jgi:hypothetical protein
LRYVNGIIVHRVAIKFCPTEVKILGHHQFFEREAMKLHEWKAKETEAWVKCGPCVQCAKVIVDGYYGRFGNGGVCSKTCNKEYENVSRNARDVDAETQRTQP